MQRYPFIDRNPCIVAAGKPIGNPCENVANAMVDVRLQDKVEAITKQLGFVEPKDYGEEWFKSREVDMSGAFSEIRHCLRPPIQTTYQAIDEEIKNTIYDSYWNKPLGKTRDQTPGLPIGMNPEEVTMGKPTEKSLDAGEVIHPRRKHEEVMAEEQFYHKLYAFSHQNYYPGERPDLCQYNPPFNKDNIFGKLTRKDDSGAKVKNCLIWFNNDPLCHVSRRQAAIRNRTMATIGKGLDRTGVTDMLPVDHVFGKPTSADYYGVEDLVNECTPSLMRRDMLTFLSYANALRQRIFKKISAGDISLEELYEEIMSLNEGTEDESECCVSFDCVDKIMKRHRIYIDHSKVQPLLLLLEILSQDGKIKVRDFISFIDKNSRFPEIKKQYYLMPPEYQDCAKKKSRNDQNDKDIYRIASMPPAGKPTIRMDKPYPIYADTIINMAHLSEETRARALISPSLYTQYGLSHRDFFRPRSKEFLGKLFRKIDVTISDEELDEIYEEGYKMDNTGGVCVETFRNILDDRAYKEYYKFSHVKN